MDDLHINDEKRPSFTAKELELSKRREGDLKKKLQESRLELSRKSKLEKDVRWWSVVGVAIALGSSLVYRFLSTKKWEKA